MSGEPLKPQTTVRDYAIKRVLGRGSFGITYLAEHVNEHFAVAIKEYFPVDYAQRDLDGTTVNASEPSEDHDGGFQSGLDRFLEESRTLGSFNNPHIVRVVDTFELNGTAYMVMQYEEGGTLARYLKAHQEPLKPEQILSIFIPVLEGLRAIHAKWLLHRDIKPDNIYIRKDGSPLLIDFGTARHALSSKKGGMTEYLTPGFAPPEQYDRKADHGPWTDVYAAGATMYYCVTRITPYEGRFRSAGSDPVMPAVQAAPAFYDRALLEIIDWMMKPEYGERPQSVDDVLDRLGDVSDKSGVERDQGAGETARKLERAEPGEREPPAAETRVREPVDEPRAPPGPVRETASPTGPTRARASLANYPPPVGEPDTESITAGASEDKSAGLRPTLMPDNVTWMTAGVVAAVTFGLGIVEHDATIVSALAIIPLATLALSILRPVHLATIAVLVLALHAVSFIGYVLGGGKFDMDDDAIAIPAILTANVVVCVVAASVAARYRRGSVSGNDRG